LLQPRLQNETVLVTLTDQKTSDMTGANICYGLPHCPQTVRMP